MIVHPGGTVSLISTLDAIRGFVSQSIHWSVGPSIRPTIRQKLSQKIPKPRTYDFFPTARAAFIGIFIQSVERGDSRTGGTAGFIPLDSAWFGFFKLLPFRFLLKNEHRLILPTKRCGQILCIHRMNVYHIFISFRYFNFPQLLQLRNFHRTISVFLLISILISKQGY